MSLRLQTASLAAFQCTGGACPDTCCKGWGMQVDRPTVERYEHDAPELRDAVVSGESEFVMRRNPDTGYCVKLGDDGWCGIHREYGTSMLGDACHFFPRMARAMGESVVVKGAMSCPELARLMLYTPDPFALVPFGDPRQPFIMRNYLPDELTEADAFALHAEILAIAADEAVSAERGLMRISTIARALETLPPRDWLAALPMYKLMADTRLPASEPSVNDPFNLVHALHGLAHAATIKPNARLMAVIDRLAAALGISFDGAQIQLNDDAAIRALRLIERSRAAWMQPLLRRALQAQLSQSLFPFSGFGSTLAERITIIGVRLATAKLALASLETPGEQAVIDTVQPLARFLDHLADPTLSLSIYRETGWVREARLRGLVGDA